MRDRLVASLVGMTIAMIALYGIPRAYLLADLVSSDERRDISNSVALLALLVQERTENATPVDQAYLGSLVTGGDTVSYVAADGSTVASGPPVDPERDVVETRAVPGGGAVTLSRSGNVVDQRISEALVPLILIGLSLTAVAALTGFLLARWLSRPFRELADAADHLGRGRFDIHFPHYSIPEAEAIGTALRSSSTQLDDLIRREREFAANASHQLRTPITALRLELEDLALWPETPPQVAKELESYLPELDRLSNAINELLGLARGRRLGDAVDVDLSALVADVVSRWRPQVEAADLQIVHVDSGLVPARVVPGPVLQILDVLIENAAAHGASPIQVEARDEERFVEIRVSDDGVRTIGNEVFQRGISSKDSGQGGLGLTIASDLATSMGGYLKLAEGEHTTFVLMLPGRGD
ncbi:HAMP domain-containing sensor histidine kinase [Nocardioides sp. 616]|uniref:sensor histidine kinase n=1 Tax=Nocardioides sp. 616 TaxID=2268090 RepID=UPI000CE3E0A1|nr:HAMP domain-containing sensor histidine kinase [Nocardioides sp. 616]